MPVPLSTEHRFECIPRCRDAPQRCSGCCSSDKLAPRREFCENRIRSAEKCRKRLRKPRASVSRSPQIPPTNYFYLKTPNETRPLRIKILRKKECFGEEKFSCVINTLGERRKKSETKRLCVVVADALGKRILLFILFIPRGSNTCSMLIIKLRCSLRDGWEKDFIDRRRKISTFWP